MSFQRIAYFFLGLTLFVSCKRDIHPGIVPPDPEITERDKLPVPAGFTNDIATIKINAIANANEPGEERPSLVRDISGNNASYCHPDVEYFPKGFNGYKYWMVFTPYFGIIGSNRTASLYELPSIFKEWHTLSGL